MAVFRCKMCGGTIEFEKGATVGVCDSCGTAQTLPTTNDEIMANLHNRANTLRLKCEFDKAEQVYSKILENDPTDAEAHWGIILCKYGIEYVEDPQTFKRVPTCHRTSYDAILADEDYKAALDNADFAQKQLYEAEAGEIDRIQRDILAIVKNEKPFDVFICYKQSDFDGKRTQDSVIANDIYHQLTLEGFKVFYAAITLEDKIGQEYEPYIFAALQSAKVMLVVGTKTEYFNAVWVKNEWSRYLKLMKTDRKKLLIPCYKDIDAYELPEEFAHLQAQDMSKIGFINDLIRGIKKVLHTETAESKPQEAAAQAAPAFNAAPLLERAFMFLEDGDWAKADDFCEQVLNLEPKNAQAYLGKLMAELRVSNSEDLKHYKEPFDSNPHYAKCVRFDSGSLKAKLEADNAFIRQRNETARLTGIYNNAQRIMQGAKTEAQYKEAAGQFKSIPGFKDADSLADECLNQVEVCRREKEEYDRLEAERIDQTVEAVKVALEKETSGVVISPEEKQTKLQGELSELTTLADMFDEKQSELKAIETEDIAISNEIQKLRDKRNSLGIFAGKEKKAIDKTIAELADKRKEFEKQTQELKSVLKGYSSKASIESEICSVQSQLKVIQGEIEASKQSSIPLLTFKQAVKALADIKVRAKFEKKYKHLLEDHAIKIFVGDLVLFGNYPQGKNNTNKTPITWRVLAKEGNKILVISEYGLECQPYNTELVDITWETCTLRTWLNGTFLDDAFSTQEQGMIQTTQVTADENTICSTDPGNDTEDKIFLLSIKEAEKYFTPDEDRKCVPTAYAKAQGAGSRSEDTKGATCWWWLRSPGYYQDNAAIVIDDGFVASFGDPANVDDECVRPALWINLE